MTTKLSEIEHGLLEAVRDMKAGRAARVHTPAKLEARRRGRPPLPAVKVPVKIRLDSDLLTTLRLSGPGWQTRINDALRREFMAPQSTAHTVLITAPLAKTRGPALWLQSLSSTMLVGNFGMPTTYGEAYCG